MASILIIYGELDKEFNAKLKLVIESLKTQKFHVTLLNTADTSSKLIRHFREKINEVDEIVFYWPRIEKLTPWQLWQIGAAEAVCPVSRLLENDSSSQSSSHHLKMASNNSELRLGRVIAGIDWNSNNQY